MGLKELINKGLDKATDKGSFFEGDGLLNVFKKITSESKADYLKKLKKNGASEEELEREADRWDRANKKGTRGGLMRKPKLAKRGF
jgi:hypothetical protein